MFQTVQLPAGVAHLDTSLANMDGQYFSHSEILLRKITQD